MNDPIVLTPGGLFRLQRRLADARAAYLAVCSDNSAAADSGDTSVWHDNFAYEENQRQMHMLARQVRELQQMLEICRVVPILQTEPERVGVGTRVVYRIDGADREQSCWVAGYDDGQPATGRVSYNSPIGRALVGAELGEIRELHLPQSTRSIEVVDITPIEREEDQ